MGIVLRESEGVLQLNDNFMDENIKNLAESILSDITSDVSIANILLKAKVFAAKYNDKDLLIWVANELRGYEKNPPEYRIIDAGVKVDIHKGFQEILGYTYPIDMVQDEKIRRRLSHIAVFNSITEIEEMGKKDDSGTIHVEVPTAIWYYHMGRCINGDIQRAYQFASLSAIKNILFSVKSLLIDYFLKISDNEDIQFGSLIKKDHVTNVTNITASIVNTGDGTVNASDVTTVIGNNNTINPQTAYELQEIIQKIDEIMKPQDDEEYKELSADVAVELKKEVPSKKFLKRCFQAIGGLANGIASGVIANQVTPYVASALALL